EGCRITEDDPPEGNPIEAAVLALDVRPERRDDHGERRATGGRHVAGHEVGIDHHGAHLTEPAGNRRLAAADWPGDADDERHGARSSSASHASSAVPSATSTSASSLETRRSSMKFDCT